MVDFKIGDRVVAKYSAGYFFTKGREYVISQIEDNGEVVVAVSDTGGPNMGASQGQFEMVDNELAELRAFRERAIERYPDLAEPESDEQARQRFYDEWNDGDESLLDILPRIFAWARANPR